ncbi:MAG: hypothetical protein Q9160_003959 [Pyrenula sp. 1 TL-2023]
MVRFGTYLQFLLPLVACGVSVLLLLVRLLRHLRPSNHNRLYQSLPTDERNGNAFLKDNDGEDDEDEEYAALTLAKTVSRTREPPEQDIDKPVGEVALVAFEFTAVAALVAVNMVALVTTAFGQEQYFGPVGGLVSWAYLLFLVSLRLISSVSTTISIPKIWYHTACLYGAQWLLIAPSFRSVFVTAYSPNGRTTIIIEFALTTSLLIIALVTRKGNKPVILEYENDLEPSREPLASVLSLATFSWVDAIVWKGFKKTYELSGVWNLNAKDKAFFVLTKFHQAKKTHSFAVRLLLYFKKDLLIQGLWAMFSNLFTYLPTLLIKAILEYVEAPEYVPKNAAWLWVILLFVSGVVQAVADGQALWIGRKVCIRLRAIIVGEIYAKALRRKAAANTGQDDQTKDADKTHPADKAKAASSAGKQKKDSARTESTDKNKPKVDQASNGTVINLMSIDSFKVAEISAYLHFLWASVPVQIVLAIVLLYRILGYSSFAGIGLMVLVIPLNLWIAKGFQRAQQQIMAATDTRIHATNEVLENIRIIKYFAWEQRFENHINEKRTVELKALRKRFILWAIAATIWSGVPIIITLISFFIYTVIEGKLLVPSIAFPALSMFSLLRVPLDQLADMIAHIQESKVSVDRIEDFLNEGETDKYIQHRESLRQNPGPPKIALHDATLTWSSKPGSAKEEGSSAFRLINMNVEFKIGALNIIAGPTGSGKSSLLYALLGEMKLLSGNIFMVGGRSRDEISPNPETGLADCVAYCAQQAWLVNDTIKGNILFASPFDEHRYKTVIDACALQRDLEILDAGDQTLVGEKGIALSGGQKQRISLARAMYSNARHILLDDCLSAVDSHTAKHIFERAIMGGLMANRTCILVTHNVSLALAASKFIVVLDNGKVVAQGHPDEVKAGGLLGEEIDKSRPGSRGNSTISSRVPSDLESQTNKPSDDQHHANGTVGGQSSTQKARPKEQENANIRVEGKETGRVKFDVLRMYMTAMGSWLYWVLAVAAFLAGQLGSLGTNIWIRQWANAYTTRSTSSLHASSKLAVLPGNLPSNGWTHISSITVPETHQSSQTPVISLTNDEVNVGYYLGIYGLIAFMYLVITLSREMVLFSGSLRASRRIHQWLLVGVMHAKFRFFDSTPLGQLMNRFSKDVEAVDQELAPVAIGFFHSVLGCVTIAILIACITPGFLIAGFFIACIYVATGAFYLRSSVDLKRLESVQRSPLYQQLGETLNGMVTIRAYGDEGRFMRDNHSRINTYNRPFIYLWSANRWLAFRADIAGAMVAFFAGAFVVLSVGKIDSGAAGLSLSYAITFTENVLWTVRLYSMNEQNMNSVERVKEYIDVEQEAADRLAETRPPPNWPSQGAVEFTDYTTSYRKDLDPVLKDVTFKVRAGEKVGIVGRTGAGKSSLTLALFRGLEADAGKIVVDDIDIGLIKLQELREAITIVPQDPTLFSGTLRSNLDPFELFTDEEIFTALRRVHLLSSTTNEPSTKSGASTPDTSSAPTVSLTSAPQDPNNSTTTTSSSSTNTLIPTDTNTPSPSSPANKNIFHNLSHPISESGSNLSQGQRQLLCLARAILKSPRVLVMDEATASIDYATDAKIQETLRELKNNTILTIAHRLQTIIDYDKVLVLEKGEVVEYDEPAALLEREGGWFRGMCETSGEWERLVEGAKRAREGRRLVDVEG